MVVSLAPAVVAGSPIGEGELLDEPMLGQEMQRAIDRAVTDTRVAATHALEDLARGQVAIGHPCTLPTPRNPGEPMLGCPSSHPA